MRPIEYLKYKRARAPALLGSVAVQLDAVKPNKGLLGCASLNPIYELLPSLLSVTLPRAPKAPDRVPAADAVEILS